MGSRVLEIRSNVLFLNELSSKSVPLFVGNKLEQNKTKQNCCVRLHYCFVFSCVGELDALGSFALPLALSNAKVSFEGVVNEEEECLDQETLKAGEKRCDEKEKRTMK
jgi:hypothetical protein